MKLISTVLIVLAILKLILISMINNEDVKEDLSEKSFEHSDEIIISIIKGIILIDIFISMLCGVYIYNNI